MAATSPKRSRAGASKSAGFVLSRLAQDHRKTNASIDRLESLLAEGLGDRHERRNDAWDDRRRIATLVDQFIDAPDDYHHILERKAWRRAWFRSGRHLPAALDIDGGHLEMREARRRYVREFENGAAGDLCALRLALADYADRARKAIRTDEQVLFPVLRRYLTREDWREFAEELRAYESVAEKLASRPMERPVDSRQ